MTEVRPLGPISVVITTYHDGPMLGEALQSVAQQTLLTRQILVAIRDLESEKRART